MITFPKTLDLSVFSSVDLVIYKSEFWNITAWQALPESNSIGGLLLQYMQIIVTLVFCNYAFSNIKIVAME